MAGEYRNLSTGDLRVMLVHSRERILPELSESLVGYAMQRMVERGVTIRLNTRVTDARPGSVTGAIFDRWLPF
jgi:NADH dehydrogenase